MLSVICFSKDRPLQADAYIESLQFCGGIPPERIAVLYTASPGISYDRAIERHPQVRWVAETDFQADVRRLVDEAEHYVLWGCDDVVFLGAFDVNLALGLLARAPNVFGFSLRLGANLHSLPDLTEEGPLLRWNWRKAPKGHWSYAWDVSASVYRRDEVKGLLARFDTLTNPNRLEAYIARALSAPADALPAPPQLASFHTSRCATLTINRVQDEFPNEFDDAKETTPEDLYAAYADGQLLDWPRFYGRSFNIIHIDAAHFGLTAEVAPPSVEVVRREADAAEQRTSVGHLRYRVILWRTLNLVKESIRPLLPRRVLAFLRNQMG